MKFVLVVDDDPEVLQYTTMTLMRSGIKALGAHSGDEAVRIFRNRQKDIRLLLTDIVMPQTTGIQLADTILSLDPKLEIIFMTGYMTDHVGQFGPALRGRKILGKPFTPQELLHAVGKGTPSSVASKL